MKKTRFIVVRHGEAEGNIIRIFHGQYNSSLTKDGHAQAARAAEFLKKYKIDHIYSSDLDRTISTAAHIAEGRNLKIKTDFRLREIDGGKWENVPWDDLPRMFPESYSNWENDISKTVMPEGESVYEMFERTKTAFYDIAAKHPGETVCIVCHGTVIRALLCLWRGVSIDEMQKMPWFDNASITIVDYAGDGCEIIEEGISSHLEGVSTFGKQDWWQRYNK